MGDDVDYSYTWCSTERPLFFFLLDNSCKSTDLSQLSIYSLGFWSSSSIKSALETTTTLYPTMSKTQIWHTQKFWNSFFKVSCVVSLTTVTRWTDWEYRLLLTFQYLLLATYFSFLSQNNLGSPVFLRLSMTACGEKLSKKKTKHSQHTQPGQIFMVQSCKKDYSFFSFHRWSFLCVLGK